MRFLRILLVIVAVVCFGVALSYPIRYRQAQEKNDSNMEHLAGLRSKARQAQAVDGSTQAPGTPAEALPGGTGSGEGGLGQAPEGQTPGAETSGGGATRSDGDGPVVSGDNGEVESPAIPSDNGEAESPAIPGDNGEVESPAIPGDGGETDGPGRTSTDAGAPGEAAPVDAGGEDGASEPNPEGQSPYEGGQQGAPGATSGGIREVTPVPMPTPEPSPTPEPTLEPNYWDLSHYISPTPTATPRATRKPQGPTPVPTPTPDRSIRTGPLPYPLKERVMFDEAAILPELREIYDLNHDLIGWLTIPDTVIDYPVIQSMDSEFYLTHDFYGEENLNGQIILDPLCDPYTPSYNLIISGHHMKNGSMFGSLPDYRTKRYWEKHKFLEFDTLMARRQYVVFAAFYSADYDEDEEGFRYNAALEYKKDVDLWLSEVKESQLYDTGIEAEFGDEFVTLTTCNRARHRNGRFVVVCRKIREGEIFE